MRCLVILEMARESTCTRDEKGHVYRLPLHKEHGQRGRDATLS